MIELGFLFWFFLAGILIATCQDLKRREVDVWLNLFLFVGGLVFFIYRIIFEKDVSLFFYLGFSILLCFILMNIFYYGRVFGGGDAMLLFAMSPVFVGSSLFGTGINIGLFVLLLLCAGSIYGIFYSLVLYFKNFKAANKEFSENFKSKHNKIFFIIGLFFVFVGIILKFLEIDYLGFSILFGILCFLFCLLYPFSKSLEKVCMIRKVRGKDLREGDWLVDDVKVGKSFVKANWEGLNGEELKMLKRKKSVLVKDGIPFLPAFVIAFLVYYFLREFLVGIF